MTLGQWADVAQIALPVIAGIAAYIALKQWSDTRKHAVQDRTYAFVARTNNYDFAALQASALAYLRSAPPDLGDMQQGERLQVAHMCNVYEEIAIHYNADRLDKRTIWTLLEVIAVQAWIEASRFIDYSRQEYGDAAYAEWERMMTSFQSLRIDSAIAEAS